ncbi:MAG TPA: DUF4382 domain-containing protein [Vicinamibacterales bacterium]|nr:DUF4382 domain-containing protein [Vicinamibacterales bacterium]
MIAVLALVLASACGESSSGVSGGGRTRVLLTDSPFPYDRIASVNIHIVRVQVAAAADTSDPGQQWTTVAEPNRTIDLLSLQSGITTVLGETSVDAGAVGAVRVVINSALSSITDNAGNAVTVRWPVHGELAIHAYVEGSLGLFGPETPRNLVIDFDVGRSFADHLGDGSLTFIPWIRALDDAGAGAVAGVVRDANRQPLRNVGVTVLSGNPNGNPATWFKIATGRTDAEGRYRVAFVLQGTYIVRAEPLGVPSSGCVDQHSVVVTNQQTTTLDIDLPAAPGTCARFTGDGGGPDTAGTGDGSNTAGGPVAGVTVTVWPGSPAVGDSSGAYANLVNARGASLYGRDVSWSVSNPSVIEIGDVFGQSAMLKIKAAGTAIVTATSDGVSGSRTVTVP